MQVTYHPLAETEAVQAAEFYESRVIGLGRDFRTGFDAAIQSILADPLRLALIDDETRLYLLKRFPYGIYFRVEAETVRVLAVKHHRRHPDSWKRRQ